MASSIDGYLGIHAQALAFESRRTELLAANIANADTPNYKARDLDFKASLASAAGSAPGAAPLQMRASAHAPGAAAALDTSSISTGMTANDPNVLYRVPMAPALDGNTVDEQLEQAAFAQNSVRYQATLTLLSGKLRALMTAITGQ
jgi:flagellar basal-body rod protein FlgB